ncbi:MAG: hypothetical protein ACRDNS_02255 [Trebonia sp.]
MGSAAAGRCISPLAGAGFCAAVELEPCPLPTPLDPQPTARLIATTVAQAIGNCRGRIGMGRKAAQST